MEKTNTFLDHLVSHGVRPLEMGFTAALAGYNHQYIPFGEQVGLSHIFCYK